MSGGRGGDCGNGGLQEGSWKGSKKGKVKMGMKNKRVTQPSFGGTGSGESAGGPVQVTMSIQLAWVRVCFCAKGKTECWGKLLQWYDRIKLNQLSP